MATLRQRRAVSSAPAASSPARALGFDDIAEWVTNGDVTFPVYETAYPIGGSIVELPEHGATSLAHTVFKRNAIVFACSKLRQDIFSEVQFRFQRIDMDTRKPGALFGARSLDILENPWPNGTTAELGARMIQDTDLAGNFYAIERNGRLFRRSPTHTSIVLSGNPMVEEYVEVVGYVYQPQGIGGLTFTYTPDEMCHWSPLPDPEAEYRGMSWITPVLREVEADGAATDHKSAYFRNGATPNFAVTVPQDVMTPAQFDDFRQKMQAGQTGARNAYKTLYLVPGADVKPLGSDLSQLAFNDTQGRDESRISSAAGVPAVLVGLKESLQGSSLNTGTQGQARRRFADGTMRPLYRSAAAALQKLAPPPDGALARLWYDDSQIAFFREDRGDSAAIEEKKAQTIRTLVDGGWEPESVKAAVAAEDLTLLKHTGLLSVQLQPPGSTPVAPVPAPKPKPKPAPPAPAA